MQEPAKLFLLILLVVLIGFSAFFSGSETALLSFSKIRLRHMARKGDGRAVALLALLKRPEKLLGTLLVGNNFVNIAAAAIATYLAVSWLSLGQGVIVVSLGMTIILLIFGEISPKTFAANHPEVVSFFILPAIKGAVWLLSPAVRAVTFFSDRLLRLAKTGPSEFFPSLSEEEIRSVIHMGYEEGVVAKEKRRMLYNILRMSQTRVREVMIPRTMITAVEVSASLTQVMEVIRKSGYSRIPVYEETLENMVGVAHTKDVIKNWEQGPPAQLKEIMRKPYFVPESARIEGLLFDLQKKGIHLALVVDEYGGLEGIVTLEDILEEIVGEIRDEHEKEEEMVRLLPDGSALAQGNVSLHELNERLLLGLESSSEHTLAGFILAHLGRIPEAGEEVRTDSVILVVEEVSRRTIRKVRIKKPQLPREKEEEI